MALFFLQMPIRLLETCKTLAFSFLRLSLYAIFCRCLAICWPSTGLAPVLSQELRTGLSTPYVVFQLLNEGEK